MLFFAALLLVLPLVPYANEYPLARFFIVNNVLARPYLAKCSDTFLRIVEGLNGLDEVQISIALQLEDAKGQHQTPIGDSQLWRDSGGIITRKSAN